MRTRLLVIVLLAFGSACGSGGGGGGAAVAVSFVAASSIVSEGDPLQIGVELELTIPALAADLTVVVSDAGTGSATAGTDYAASGAQTIVFPAGAVDGATAFVTLDALVDGVFEGADETLELALGVPAGGAAVRRRKHRVALLDRDVVALEFLAARPEVCEDNAPFHALQLRAFSPTGSVLGQELVLTVRDLVAGAARPGTDYRFAPRVLRLEPGPIEGVETVELEVLADSESEGNESLFLRLEADEPAVLVPEPVLEVVLTDPPDLAQPFLLVRAPGLGLTDGSELDFEAGEASALELELVNRGREPLHVGFPLLDGDARDFRIEFLGLASLPLLAATPDTDIAALRAGVPRARIALADGARTTLELERRPAPVAPGARLALDGAARPLRADGVFYGGRVTGEPDSSLFLALTEAGACGWLERGGATRRLVLGEERGALRVLPGGRALVADLRSCELRAAPAGPAGSERLGVLPAAPLPTLRIAVETDTAFFQIFGDADAAEAYVIGLVAATREIYRRELGLDLELAYVGLYAGADPWHTPDIFGTSVQLLNEFDQRWTTQGAPAEAEINHFLSGVNLGGGVARLFGYCDTHGAFGASTGLVGLIDWASFDGRPDFANWDLYIFAHELGHNLGVPHTQDYCPPLDQCVANCTGTIACTPGTLMSYCHQCGGMENILFRLHPFTADSMRHSAEFSCLPDAELAGGSSLRYRLTFEPDMLAPDPARRRHAQLTLRQDAVNAEPQLSFTLAGKVP